VGRIKGRIIFYWIKKPVDRINIRLYNNKKDI